jgi:hypothetical protein
LTGTTRTSRCAIKGFKLRVKVERSIANSSASRRRFDEPST